MTDVYTWEVLPSMQMVDGLCDQWFLHIVVTSRGQVDVLAVHGLLFMEIFLEKKLSRMVEILFAGVLNSFHSGGKGGVLPPRHSTGHITGPRAQNQGRVRAKLECNLLCICSAPPSVD